MLLAEGRYTGMMHGVSIHLFTLGSQMEVFRHSSGLLHSRNRIVLYIHDWHLKPQQMTKRNTADSEYNGVRADKGLNRCAIMEPKPETR